MIERLKSLITSTGKVEVVGEAINSAEAFKLFENFNPDILLIDIHLPGENGLKTMSSLKNINSKIKVIVATNTASFQYRAASFQMGANYFIDKSNDFQKIPLILSEIVNNELQKNA
jgi:DNA-binding NarL/FixJ family response regulator